MRHPATRWPVDLRYRFGDDDERTVIRLVERGETPFIVLTRIERRPL
jgi:hypothetical protein